MKIISDIQFDTLHWINDDRNFHIQQYIDNNSFTLITTPHTPKENIGRINNKPRFNRANKNHILLVWVKEYKTDISVPRSIDYYYQCMLGVDGSDQLITNYHHSICFRRIWVPFMFRALYLIMVHY